METFELTLVYTDKEEKYHYTDIADAVEAYYYFCNAIGGKLIYVELKE